MQNSHVGLGCLRNLVLRRVVVGLSDSSSSRASLSSYSKVCRGVWGTTILVSSSSMFSVSTADRAGKGYGFASSVAFSTAVSKMLLVSESDVCQASSDCAKSADGVSRALPSNVGVSGDGSPCQRIGTCFFLGVHGSSACATPPSPSSLTFKVLPPGFWSLVLLLA
jgi:hypothetical protein